MCIYFLEHSVDLPVLIVQGQFFGSLDTMLGGLNSKEGNA